MTSAELKDLSLIFDAVNRGDKEARERLFEVVYDELHRMAHGLMAKEPPGPTFQTTALVNEAYLRLERNEKVRWENRRHFFGAAARAMRQILVDRARKRRTIRHGGDTMQVSLSESMPGAERSPDSLIALDVALNRLEETLPRNAEVVKYRYFLGFTIEETADVLGVSRRTVSGDWEFAKAWLRREITTSSIDLDHGAADGS